MLLALCTGCRHHLFSLPPCGPFTATAADESQHAGQPAQADRVQLPLLKKPPLIPPYSRFHPVPTRPVFLPPPEAMTPDKAKAGTTATGANAPESNAVSPQATNTVADKADEDISKPAASQPVGSKVLPANPEASPVSEPDDSTNPPTLETPAPPPFEPPAEPAEPDDRTTRGGWRLAPAK